jgi:hypothetical protein
MLEQGIFNNIYLLNKISYFSYRGIFNSENSWRTNLLYPIFPTVGPRNGRNFTGGPPS